VKLAQKQGKGNDLPQPNVGRAPRPPPLTLMVNLRPGNIQVKIKI